MSTNVGVEVRDVVVDESPGEVDCCHQRSWDGDAAVSEQFARNKTETPYVRDNRCRLY